MRRRILLALPILCLFASASFAKEYKVNELLEIAEKNSGNIRAAEHLAQSQKHFANQQKYWNNPTVGFGRIGGQNTYNITQSVPFYNKLQSRYDIENADFRALDARKNNLTILVKAEVFSLLYRYQGLKKKIELAQKRLDRLSLIDRYLSMIVLSSPTQKAQSQITKDRIKLVERDLIKYKNELYQTWNAANIYLNLESEPSTISIIWLSEENYPGRKSLINAALENNWSLKEQKILISKAKAESSYAKIEQMPDVNISATRENGNNALSQNNGSASGLGLSLSIPLINRNQEKIIGAESKIKAQEAAFEFERNQLVQLINNDINEYETALKLAKNFPIKDIDKVISRLASANSSFKKGILDFITYLELDSQEYEIIDAIIDTQIDLASSYAQMMTKVGNFAVPE